MLCYMYETRPPATAESKGGVYSGRKSRACLGAGVTTASGSWTMSSRLPFFGLRTTSPRSDVSCDQMRRGGRVVVGLAVVAALVVVVVLTVVVVVGWTRCLEEGSAKDQDPPDSGGAMESRAYQMMREVVVCAAVVVTGLGVGEGWTTDVNLLASAMKSWSSERPTATVVAETFET